MRAKPLPPDRYKASLAYARALAHRYHEYSEAVEGYSDLLKGRPKEPILYLERGRNYLELREYRRALADATEAIRLGPAAHEPYLLRARVRSALRDPAGAVLDYSTLVKIGLRKELHQYHYSRAQEYVRLGHLADALADLDQAIMLAPGEVAFWRSRAAVRRRRWDLSGAIRDYTNAIKLDPRHAADYHDRARVFELRGDLLSALEDYAAAHKLAPWQAPIRAAYRDVERRLKERLRLLS